MEKKTHGGKRTGAGRKRVADKKQARTVRITDTNRAVLIEKYGSLQKAVDYLVVLAKS